MTVLLKYRDGVHVYDDMESAIAKQSEIGGELFVPQSTIAALTAERDGLLESLRIANERVADFENGITTLHLQFGEPYYSWQRVLYRVQQLVRRRNACGEACLNAIGYLRGGSILDEKQLIGRLINAVMPLVNAKGDELPIYEVPALMPTESEAES